ncbi:hypothetical protein H6778_03235 [Candidatus Nomurabacteria bacterium]|nr:hypothetical protein [Candidatus Nomurabacteria bacterium]
MTWTDKNELLQPDTCVVIKGKFNVRNDEPSILIDKVKKLGNDELVGEPVTKN